MKRRVTNTSALEGTTGIRQQRTKLPQRTVVIDIPLEMIRLNPLNPRQVIPADILADYGGVVRAVQATVERARKLYRFDHVTDLLSVDNTVEPDAIGNEFEPAPSEDDLPPLVARVRHWTRMAMSYKHDGQINPVTVIEVEPSRKYEVESGDIRVISKAIESLYLQHEPTVTTVRCTITPADKVSVFRTSKENMLREPLKAIETAIQIGLLLLHVHGYDLSQGYTPELLRKASELTLYGVDTTTKDQFYSALNDMNRSTMTRFKHLLRLSPEAMAYANDCDLELTKLSLVVSRLPEDQHFEAVRHIVTSKMTVDDLREYLDHWAAPQATTEQSEHQDMLARKEVVERQRKARREIRTLGAIHRSDLNDLVAACKEKRTKAEAMALIESSIRRLEEVRQHLSDEDATV